MIAGASECEKAQEELRGLEARLRRIEAARPMGEKGFTKGPDTEVIARVQEELAVYEGREEG